MFKKLMYLVTDICSSSIVMIFSVFIYFCKCLCNMYIIFILIERLSRVSTDVLIDTFPMCFSISMACKGLTIIA